MKLIEFLTQVGWRPQIGDPSLMGWLTVGVYAVAALLCVAVAWQTTTNRQAHRAWVGLAGGVGFLGIVKATNFFTFFTQLGRTLSYSQQWYEYRQLFQMGMIGTAVVLILGLMLLTLRAFRKATSFLRMAIVGALILVAFVVLRAASLHAFDALIQSQIVGIRINWILELGCLLLIVLPAGMALRQRPFSATAQPATK